MTCKRLVKIAVLFLERGQVKAIAFHSLEPDDKIVKAFLLAVSHVPLDPLRQMRLSLFKLVYLLADFLILRYYFLSSDLFIPLIPFRHIGYYVA